MAAHQEPGVQLTLLSGFVGRERVADPHSGVELAPALPVAQVVIDSALPHLDRVFDYSVPKELDADAQPGVRVRVKFSGQDLNGFLVGRAEHSESERLVPLSRVYSAVPVLAPQVLELARRVAARYSGTVADVLRVAVPPRVASLDKGYLKQLQERADAAALAGAPAAPGKGLDAGVPGGRAVPAPPPAAHPGHSLFRGYAHAEDFLTRLAMGASPKAVLQSLSGYGPASWHHQLAQAAAYCQLSGRGAIVVVPDLRDLELLEKACASVLPAGSFVKLTADDAPSLRYDNFLRVLSGDVKIVIGTRSAAYAPVTDLGLVCCWDDGDELHLERRTPYQHSRDVLLLRSEVEDTAVLMACHSRSMESQRLVATGWAQSLVAERPVARTETARVVSTADSWEQERDPLASLARLPHRAWESARAALKSGPVLVQVARTGYAPALACQRCREAARCTECTGPLMQSRAPGSSQVLVTCRWCGRAETSFSCPTCGNHTLRASAVGALRTAEELGRAFPSVPVISSAGDHVKAVVPDRPAIVVATVGAEPVAPRGYAAALLLDGDAMLRRESLRSGEDTLRRWMNAAALVRPAREGGTVVVTADDSIEVQALVRWDPAGYAEREFGLRHELGLPPAVRVAALTGAEADVVAFAAALDLPESARTVGPAPVPGSYGARPGVDGDSAPDYRTLVFFPYAMAATVTGAMRALKAANAARKVGSAVQVRCDGVDVI
ncbi:primosomal protein N' (replication factor Y) [Arthrobacter silviterrae]|uniref:Probable replication restart protein PriA n=1 Tax=Arthrobacter silviterrae TaxID=2026658 RepID=A0ABX0D6M3_9MICC|nr:MULTISPECIES: primosomal protein N' [Arthrobacter]MCU6478766.1 primosomal protein N' [Arthrobacter sp. A2-55]MDQ0276290.1 primosomal protein N' (replication factor Y) [Arthrobacter silviterrae]NGN82529.1 primosomal protein N' [Arthrobacter silviterrae]